MSKNITLYDIKNNEDFSSLINGANEYLRVKGYTEHGFRHVSYVSKTTGNILRTLGYPERTVELGEITGWIHDIGNAVNRKIHGLVGAQMAFQLLYKMGMGMDEIVTICMAIGNHEEDYGMPVNPVSAALILADKSDAHRTRVRSSTFNEDDIHDRVNYSIQNNFVVIDTEKKVIRLVLHMDTTKSSHMDYFQIYLSRMVFCEQASDFLGYGFELMINDVVLNKHKVMKNAQLKLDKGQRAVSEE